MPWIDEIFFGLYHRTTWTPGPEVHGISPWTTPLIPRADNYAHKLRNDRRWG